VSEADAGSFAELVEQSPVTELSTARATQVDQSSVAEVAGARASGGLASPLARLGEPRAWSAVRLLADVVVLYLASTAALLADPSIRSVTTDQLLAAIFPLIVLGILYVRPDRHDQLGGSQLDAAAAVCGAVALAAMMTIALDSILGNPQPVGFAVRLWLFGSVYLGVARLALLSLRQHLRSTRGLATPTLVVGAGIVGERVVRRLVGNPAYGLKPVGFLDADPLPRESVDSTTDIPVLGGLDDLAEAVKRTGARQVILAFTSEPDHVLVHKVRECQRLGVAVSLVPRLFESVSVRSSLDYVGGLPLLTLRSTDPRSWQFVIKHAIDRTAASLALIALAPLMTVIALAVRMTSSGPVLFKQRRVGRDGQVFDLLKFRTMQVADAGEQSFDLPEGVAPGGVEGADRRTPVGRWLRGSSLDELPQFINVLRGDMSLVGPRPERPRFVERFLDDVSRYDDRHRVKAGITGWAQVNGLRGRTSIADRVEWDNYYIENWSLWLDLRILAFTVAEVLRFRDGA
jgi:exopolysaccharide biosynthesis polyprenyl glycosylphosphotransferase